MKSLLCLLIFCSLSYGLGRLYYQVTDGFALSNITENFPYDPQWETPHKSNREDQAFLKEVFDQKFSYIGKGCQSYAFGSDDGRYVVKFFKFHRFRTHPGYRAFSFIPVVHKRAEERAKKKHAKKNDLFTSCHFAYKNIPEETGLMYVHLNQTSSLQKKIIVKDKIGWEYEINLDDHLFVVQKRGQMLCSTLNECVAEGELDKAKQLITDLIGMVVSEYHRGIGDLDQAIMQNTGVADGSPFHLDIGQIYSDVTLLDASIYHQELYNRTFKFRKWLGKHHPELLLHLESELRKEMGDKFDQLVFIPNIH